LSKQNLELARFASAGIHITVCMAIGGGFGYWLDKKFDTEPVFVLIFLLFGVAAGFLNLFRELAIINKAEADEQEKDREGE